MPQTITASGGGRRMFLTSPLIEQASALEFRILSIDSKCARLTAPPGPGIAHLAWFGASCLVRFGGKLSVHNLPFAR